MPEVEGYLLGGSSDREGAVDEVELIARRRQCTDLEQTPRRGDGLELRSLAAATPRPPRHPEDVAWCDRGECRLRPWVPELEQLRHYVS